MLRDTTPAVDTSARLLHETTPAVSVAVTPDVASAQHPCIGESTSAAAADPIRKECGHFPMGRCPKMTKLEIRFFSRRYANE